ncbi:hypothetical protein FQN60_017106 [Etheostoma spectabile]|uniref:Small ribosomal subunit protein eS19 n=1 Tax=Etheostoma spectabile TaxID=54343 RepID=A0A5J5DEJ5_9PERO|nr:hypothetical protein FQN60_017106 [Etheostoma spectabile]
MVNCLASRGKHTKMMHVYRHCGVRRLSNTLTGTPTAPPIAPTQPRHSRRQHETLPGWGLDPWVPSWTSATVQLPLTAMHNLTLTTIKDTDRMHWHRAYSHKKSILWIKPIAHGLGQIDVMSCIDGNNNAPVSRNGTRFARFNISWKPRSTLFPSLSTSKMPGVTVKDVNQQEFVRALSAFLKKSGKLKVPDWVDLVKLGKHKELAPSDENWFYIRAGAGVGSMTKIYGSRQRNGVCPAHYSVGSKNVARKVLQALELLKMIEKDPNGGRRLTAQGTRDLDRIAGQVRN